MTVQFVDSILCSTQHQYCVVRSTNTVQYAAPILCSTQHQSKHNTVQYAAPIQAQYCVVRSTNPSTMPRKTSSIAIQTTDVCVLSVQPNVLVNTGVELSWPKVKLNLRLLQNTATVLCALFVVQRYVAIIDVCH